MSKIRLIHFIVAIISAFSGYAESLKSDSLHTKHLQVVVVNGRRSQNTTAAIPLQQLGETELKRINSSSVSDAMKHFAGVTVKDFGGIGGLKTVCLRGFSAQHTGVSYDGIMLSDIQTGQIDLGRYSLNNLSEIELSNAQPGNLLQSARMFASAGVISLSSRLIDADSTGKANGSVGIKGGSFGLINPSFFITKSITKKFILNLSSDGIVANGRFTFLQNYYPSNSNGIKETLSRDNSDIQSFRTEVNAIYKFSSRKLLSAKANYYDSERGLPGAVTFYNTFSRARLWDNMFFGQIRYEDKSTERLQTTYAAKYNVSGNRFRNFNTGFIRPTNPEGEYREQFTQSEYYSSAALVYRPVNQLSLALAADGWYNTLNINRTNASDSLNQPQQYTGLVNFAGKYTLKRWTLSANALFTLTHNEVKKGIAAPNRNQISPFVGLTYQLRSDKDWRIRFFYKNIFRTPSFNDLYYQDMGNKNLKPESTNQFNIGLAIHETDLWEFSSIEINLDGYYNIVTDKIIALPKDLFHWSMANKGKVIIKGADLSLKATLPVAEKYQLSISSSYTLQKATDETTNSANLGEQIPYSPVHSGSASLSFQHCSNEFGYTMLFASERWSGQNTPSNHLNGYAEHSLFASKSIRRFKFTGEIINLLNTQYEVVQFFPMPRRNFRLTAILNF